MTGKYARERKEKQPVVAICYDFDKTLSPDDMQAQGYIQSVGYDVAEFWKESNELAERNGMDQNLAYMLMMKKKPRGNLCSRGKTFRITARGCGFSRVWKTGSSEFEPTERSTA